MTGSRRIGAAGATSLLAVVLVGASCGGGGAASSDATGSAGTGGSAAPGTPVAQCKEVVSTLCNRDNSCHPSQMATAQNLMDCQTLNGIAFGCDRATVSFGDCLTDVKVVSCASLFPATGSGLPPSCNDPIDAIPLSTAQQKCGDLAEVVCERSAGCQGITPSPAQLQNCQLQAFSDLDCLFAIDVSATFDQCLKDLPAFPCQNPDGGAGDGGMPSEAGVPSCNDPLVFPPVTP
jgi:hypothetical protein